jgi:transposase
MENTITYVAMDTHKKEHKVAFNYPGKEVIENITVRNTACEISKMVKKILKKAPGQVWFCYEAGVCGFDLKRKIESLGCKCSVIAPTLTPVKPGNRIKTDRRDAVRLLAMFKAGLLTEVYAPDPQQEAARELSRLHQTARENLMRIHHQLLKFLTRHGYIYHEGDHWTLKHLRWLRNLEFEEPLLKEIFDSYFTEMQHCMQRLDSLAKQVEQLAESEPYKEIVGLLKCFHGIKTLTAISIITEIFDFGRFANPRDLMSYLGLVPSESSSGEKQKKGSITRTGNKRVRRLLIEVSWHYRHPYHISKALKQRRNNQPQWVIDITDRAGHRLRKRYWYLVNRGKMPCKAMTAVARELAGFLWSVFREYELRKTKKAA